MKFAVATLLTSILALAPARADTPEWCVPIASQAPTTVEVLPSTEREAARSILRLASEIARDRGSTALPILVRLRESRPGSAHLVAYVPGENDRLVALVYRATASEGTHSLVDAQPFLLRGVLEARYDGGRTTDGSYFRFYDFDRHMLGVIDTVTHRQVTGQKPPEVRKVTIDTGYGFGGPSAFCRDRAAKTAGSATK